MNIGKTDYKTLKFEEKPLNTIKTWTIHALSEDGDKNYKDKSSPAVTFLNRPNLKMVQNIYDKKDKLLAENYPNIFEDSNKVVEEKENEENEENMKTEMAEENKEEEVNKVNEEEKEFQEVNENRVSFKINDAKSDFLEIGNEKSKPNLNLDLEGGMTKSNSMFYKSGFSTHKRSHSNLFGHNSNGVEKILGSNELNFRCTTHKDKIAMIYNNSIRNYEKNLVVPQDAKYKEGYIKELDSIFKKIETPSTFFGITPTSNIYLFSKKRREQSLEGKGIGFESFNVPRVDNLKKSTSKKSLYSNVKGHCNNIANALKISSGINPIDIRNHKKWNNNDIEFVDDDNNPEVLSKNENMKLKKTLLNYHEQSNFSSKLPIISRIVRENPKLKISKIKKGETGGLYLGEKYNPDNFNSLRGSSTSRNSFGAIFQY